MKYFLVIDAGTGSGRVVVFDEAGQQLAIAQEEWTHQHFSGLPGAIDFDTEANWQIILKLIGEAVSRAGSSASLVRAISTTSMREGIVLYNKDGQEIWACSNVDARSSDEAIWLRENVSEERFYQITGQTFSISDVPRLLWVKRNLPEVFAQIDSFGMISDWIVTKLTGEFVTEPTNASTSGFFDIAKRNWSKEMLEFVELSEDVIPRVQEPGTIAGQLKPEIRQRFGFAPDTVVVMGGGDAQLGTVGVGAVQKGNAVILGGTFWQQEVNVDNVIPHPDCKVRINAHAVPDMWQYEGISFQLGLVMRWFRDGFCHREKDIARELGLSAYTLLAEMADTIPKGASGIIPIHSDVMNYLHWKHAAPSLLNFDINNPANNGKAAVFRALMENAAFNCLGNLKIIQEASGHFPAETIFAGGASNSPVWCQILANVLGIPVKVPVVRESTALGAFICAAVGVGHFKSFVEATEAVSLMERVHLPNPRQHERYLEQYERWRAVYPQLLELADRGLTQHMWRAPGE